MNLKLYNHMTKDTYPNTTLLNVTHKYNIVKRGNKYNIVKCGNQIQHC